MKNIIFNLFIVGLLTSCNTTKDLNDIKICHIKCYERNNKAAVFLMQCPILPQIIISENSAKIKLFVYDEHHMDSSVLFNAINKNINRFEYCIVNIEAENYYK